MTIGVVRPPPWHRPLVNFLLFLNYPSTHYIIPSSALVEGNFGTSGLIMRPKRARLSLEMLEILVYLKFSFLEK